ncbi:MAG: hypothetical protein EOP81_11005 [Variovorax sp.]|nr:MAG: hypothetical protein EOP81_11005 [Variovorax sp.]
MTPGMQASWRLLHSGLLRVGLPLWLLNTLLSFVNPGPTPWPEFSARLAPELCLAMAGVAGWIAWRGRLPGRTLHALAALTAMLVAVRAIEVTSAAMFGRSLNLYWDGRHLGEVLAMNGVPAWQIAGGVLLVAAAIVALYLLALWSWRALRQGLAHGALRGSALLAVAAALAALALHGAGGPDTGRFFAEPVAPVMARQARLVVAQLRADGTESRLTPSPSFDADLAALRGADVLLLFAESYGVSTLDDPVQTHALAAPRARLAEAIAASGRHVVSARVRSPTFAGGSWLAHGALLSGVDTRDPLDYDVLLSTERPSLPRQFGARGYRTVSWMPGLQRPWPEGRFFGFDRYVDATNMGYAGPAFGPWRVPDQAAMALLHAQELAAPATARLPRFVVFPTVASHAPFRPVAPFMADWTRLTGPTPYTPEEHAHALDEPASWRDPVPGYVHAIASTWEWLGAYLRERAPPRLFTIVIGDHQAFAGVSGAGATWDVPVHLISDDAALLARFKQAGFVEGLTPRGPPLGDMHALTPLLLRTLSTP